MSLSKLTPTMRLLGTVAPVSLAASAWNPELQAGRPGGEGLRLRGSGERGLRGKGARRVSAPYTPSLGERESSARGAGAGRSRS